MSTPLVRQLEVLDSFCRKRSYVMIFCLRNPDYCPFLLITFSFLHVLFVKYSTDFKGRS